MCVLANELSEERRLREVLLGVADHEEDLVQFVKLVQLVVIQKEPIKTTKGITK